MPERCSECIYCKWLDQRVTDNICGDLIVLRNDQAILDEFGNSTIAFCNKFNSPINGEVMVSTRLDKHPGFIAARCKDRGYIKGKCKVEYASTCKSNYISSKS